MTDKSVLVVTADQDLAAELPEHLLTNKWGPTIKTPADPIDPDLDAYSVVMLDQPSRELWHAAMSAQAENGNQRPIIMVWVPPEEAEQWADDVDIVVEKPVNTAKIDAGLESFLGTKTGMTTRPDAWPTPQSMRPDS